MRNIYRDLHLLLDTLGIQLTKLGKNVAHVSKLFILEALKQGYLLPITKNYFDDSTAPPPPQSTHKLLSSCYDGANPLTYYLQNKVHTIAFILLDCL